MLADLFTKTFTDVKNFQVLRTAIGISSSSEKVVEEVERRAKFERKRKEPVDLADAKDA